MGAPAKRQHFNSCGELLCTKCEQYMSTYFFVHSSNGKNRARNGYSYWCSTCQHSYRKDWRKRNPDKDQLTQRRSDYKRLYGITLEQFEAMMFKQNDRCSICEIHIDGMPQPKNAKTKRTFDVDHDHITGAVRGLLCHNCNKGLGNFFDSVDSLERAIKYLKVSQISLEDLL